MDIVTGNISPETFKSVTWINWIKLFSDVLFRYCYVLLYKSFYLYELFSEQNITRRSVLFDIFVLLHGLTISADCAD